MATFEIPLVTKQESVTAMTTTEGDDAGVAAAAAAAPTQTVLRTYVDCKTSMNVLANF